ncbi:hypothetical protein DAEQUDRAFT_342783 [Daedalea quercina L-15889]|uniref:Uncharacterized protein n=1 Tax=Daedalea quercina L-15889 TaxID=1314783 RepID=A0A165PG13_9APHY|nr:hypothetical protein DAEQUDRAFT_342783 [Daedalea quercina L-15889]
MRRYAPDPFTAGSCVRWENVLPSTRVRGRHQCQTPWTSHSIMHAIRRDHAPLPIWQKEDAYAVHGIHASSSSCVPSPIDERLYPGPHADLRSHGPLRAAACRRVPCYPSPSARRRRVAGRTPHALSIGHSRRLSPARASTLVRAFPPAPLR